MSLPRTFARHLFFLTVALLLADAVLLIVSGGVVGMAVSGGSLVLHAAMGAGWRLRMTGRLRPPLRQTIWGGGAAVYSLTAIASLLSGGLATTGLGLALNVSALALVVGGAVAEHRRTKERMHFIMRPA